MSVITALITLLSFAIAQPSIKPSRVQHMLYDTQHKQIMLLSASSESGFEEVWSWNGSEWKLSSVTGPPARETGAAVYDTLRNRIVLFGGIGIKSQEDRLGDLWESNGKRWEQSTGATNNGTRDHHYIAFDESRGRAVVYGGQPTDRSWLTDTSEWDGSKWVKINSTSPGGRVHFAMVYDSWRKRVLLFGGFDEAFKAHNDLWSWDGKKWEKLSEGGPAPRSHHAMAFVAERLHETGELDLADALDTLLLKKGVKAAQMTHLFFSFSGNAAKDMLKKSLDNYDGPIPQTYVGLHVDKHQSFIEDVFKAAGA